MRLSFAPMHMQHLDRSFGLIRVFVKVQGGSMLCLCLCANVLVVCAFLFHVFDGLLHAFNTFKQATLTACHDLPLKFV